MKKLLIAILSLIIIFTCVGCSTPNTNGNNGDNSGGIYYSSSVGTKIDTLSTAKQQTLDKYVNDCKSLYIVSYRDLVRDRGTIQPLKQLSFTDTFVYDFSGVNFASPSATDNNIIKQLKHLKDDQSLPIMYVELYGYATYYPDYKITSLIELPLTYGFFIYQDNTIVSMNYQHICGATLTYKLLDGTTTINCGNKYAQELIHSEIDFFVLDLNK